MFHSMHALVWTTQTPQPLSLRPSVTPDEVRCEADTKDGGVCMTRLFSFDSHCPNQWQHNHGTEAAT